MPLVAMAGAMPFAEAGFVDDFSYIHMAKRLAETGRFAYNGWPTAMLGIQIWWGAAWVWLFGFSFTLVRLSVLPFALGAVAVAYLLARRADLSPSDSLFVALLMGLSTLFLPLAPTFMSDVPALFWLLASVYGFAAAADAAEEAPARRRHALAWLAFGTFCAVLGGTIRQSVWFAPIACAAVLCLRRSGCVMLRLAALLSAAIGAAAILLGTAWFSRQAYEIPTRLPALDGLAELNVMSIAGDVGAVVAEPVLKVLPAVLFCLPWVLAHAADALRTRWGRRTAAAAIAAMAFVYAGTILGWCEPQLALLGGWWRPVGHLAHDAGVGAIRCGVLGLVVALAMAATAAARRRADPAEARRLPPAVVMPLAYLVPYACSLVLVARTTTGIFPRYFLPFLPALSCWLLSCARPSSTQSRPAAGQRSLLGWLLVGFFAFRGIAISHDEFADTRSRLAAIAFLEGQGVARERITSKWGIDGWEQIEREGHVNDPRIRVPPAAYRGDVPGDYPDPNFAKRFPALHPDFIVAETRETMPGDDAGLPRFPYIAWLRRPHHREIVIRARPPRDGADRAADGNSR